MFKRKSQTGLTSSILRIRVYKRAVVCLKTQIVFYIEVYSLAIIFKISGLHIFNQVLIYKSELEIISFSNVCGLEVKKRHNIYNITNHLCLLTIVLLNA